MLIEDTWTVLVLKKMEGVHNIIPCLFKKIQFLIFWNEVRHEAPHCTR